METLMFRIPRLLRNRSLTMQVMVPTLLILAVTAAVLVVYLRQASRQHTVLQAEKYARNIITQYEILRGYYSNHVIEKVRKHTNLDVTHQHKTSSNSIP